MIIEEIIEYIEIEIDNAFSLNLSDMSYEAGRKAAYLDILEKLEELFNHSAEHKAVIE